MVDETMTGYCMHCKEVRTMLEVVEREHVRKVQKWTDRPAKAVTKIVAHGICPVCDGNIARMIGDKK